MKGDRPSELIRHAPRGSLANRKKRIKKRRYVNHWGRGCCELLLYWEGEG